MDGSLSLSCSKVKEKFTSTHFLITLIFSSLNYGAFLGSNQVFYWKKDIREIAICMGGYI